MDEKKSKGIRQICLNQIKDRPDLATGIMCYLFYGTVMNPTYQDLSDKNRKSLHEFMSVISLNFTEILDEMFEDGMPKDFDLFQLCSENAHGLAKEHKVKDDKVVDMLLTALAATFRIWYEHITLDDIVAFFEEREHRELPSMVDSSITFAWAIDNSIPCSDMKSMHDYAFKHEKTAEETKVINNTMDFLRESFNKCKPVLEDSGVPKSFLDENLETCQNFFMLGFALFQTIPATVDAQKIIFDDKQYKAFFKNFIDNMASPALKKELKNKEYKSYYALILRTSMMLTWNQDKDGACRKEMFETTTKEMAKKHTQKK